MTPGEEALRLSEKLAQRFREALRLVEVAAEALERAGQEDEAGGFRRAAALVENAADPSAWRQWEQRTGIQSCADMVRFIVEQDAVRGIQHSSIAVGSDFYQALKQELDAQLQHSSASGRGTYGNIPRGVFRFWTTLRVDGIEVHPRFEPSFVELIDQRMKRAESSLHAALEAQVFGDGRLGPVGPWRRRRPSPWRRVGMWLHEALGRALYGSGEDEPD